MLPKGRTILSMLAVTLHVWTEQWRIDLYKTSKAMVDHGTNAWCDYHEDNAPCERLEKVYVPDEDS